METNKFTNSDIVTHCGIDAQVTMVWQSGNDYCYRLRLCTSGHKIEGTEKELIKQGWTIKYKAK